MDAELERFKTEISLSELAGSYGYAIDDRESCQTCVVMRNGKGSKIVVATDTDGHGIYFDVHNDMSRGSIIDFVKNTKGVNLGQARVILRDWISNPTFSFPTAHRAHTRPKPITRDRASLFTEWQKMEPYSGWYLQGRGLTSATIAKFSEHIRISVSKDGKFHNVVFRHDDGDGVSGWEIKNRGFTGGAGKALFCAQVGDPATPPPAIVVAESAIDAMSYYQLHPAYGMYISVAGGMSPEQKKQLAGTLTRYPDSVVLIATDNDKDGDKYADFIREVRLDAVRAALPVGKDWNDTLNDRQARRMTR